MLRIRRQKDLSGSVRSDIEWTLAQCDDKGRCVEAIDAAIDLKMDEVVQAALDHQFAHVAARALSAIASEKAAPMPAKLLALMSSAGSPVRKALADVLVSKPHAQHLPALLHLVKDQWSSFSRYYGENDVFPIARLAVDALANMGPLGADAHVILQATALETSDWAVRTGLFSIIGATGDEPFQKWLLELAVNPGRLQVRRAAAFALLSNCETLDSSVVRAISLDVLSTVTAAVAPLLTIVSVTRMTSDERLELARGISANPRRRALLVLMLWPKLGAHEETVKAIESLLPKGHLSVLWVRNGPSKVAEDDLIADLGEPGLCQAILDLLNPKPVKS
jgi:HEAT repeat protein